MITVKPFRKLSGIYAIVNYVTDKYYVGQAADVGNRLSVHLSTLRRGIHDSTKLQRSWKKHGEQKFYAILLDTELSDEAEQKWMDFFDAVISGYNILPKAGSCRGHKRSDKTKKRLSEIAIQIADDPEEKLRRSIRAKKQHAENNFGRQTWTKPPVLLKGPESPMYGRKGSNHPKYGRKETDETRKKKRDTKLGELNPQFGKPSPRKGLKASSETCEKLSTSWTVQRKIYQAFWTEMRFEAYWGC